MRATKDHYTVKLKAGNVTLEKKNIRKIKKISRKSNLLLMQSWNVTEKKSQSKGETSNPKMTVASKIINN